MAVVKLFNFEALVRFETELGTKGLASIGYIESMATSMFKLMIAIVVFKAYNDK